MPAVREPQRPSTSAIPLRLIWQITVGAVPTTKLRLRRKKILGAQHLLEGLGLPMPSGYMTCMETSGNGAPITGMEIMKGHQSMGAPGLILILKKMLLVCCGAVPGATIRDFAVLRLAAALGRGFASTTSVFVLSVLRRGLLLSPLLSCPLTLCTSSLFTLFSRFARSVFFISKLGSNQKSCYCSKQNNCRCNRNRNSKAIVKLRSPEGILA